ncbi:selenium-dependent xanthine dehydrogenase [Eubacteriaceae bacterium ES3]|nr:selenium-dependent xanthine dehydrogenase [Eubacteriaceae bacterium ES3]
MYTFWVNGIEISTALDKNLLDFIRDELDITSLKNGCKEGSCGACMVLIDGKKGRACKNTTAKVNGKNIITVEGLSEREKEVYDYCFKKAGGVQCGFCTPGMIISAKSLLDTEKNPSSSDVKKAIKGNICRCTGYKKIEEAILQAADFFRVDLPIPVEKFTGKIGERTFRPDAMSKIDGSAKYVEDIKVEGMIYGSALRSRYPRALVKDIDITQAIKHPDAVAIVLAEDVPGQRYIGHLTHDWPALIAKGEITRYLGDSIALVAAKNSEALQEIKDLIDVQYQELEPMLSAEQAIEKNAEDIHEGGNIYRTEVIKRGQVDKALRESAHVVTMSYSTPHQEHAFLEPETALAVPEQERLTVYTGGQGIYDEYREISMLLGIPKEKLRIKSAVVGGGFGGKEDMSVQHHAALLAYITKLPVRVSLTREESFLVHPKRHPMEMELTTACDKDGRLTAMKLRLNADTGAYASLGGPVLQRACTHAAGPYNYQNIDIIGKAVYTNNVPSGAFRGFGVTQTIFATECNINLLAEKVGLDPYEIRHLNAIRPGQTLPNGQIVDEGTGLLECIEAVKDAYYDNYKRAGIACAIKNAGVGVGIPDTGRVRLVIIDGKVSLRTSASCMGQGIAETMRTILCQTTGLKPEDVIVSDPDTDITPDSGTSTASRQTVINGETTRRASLKLAQDLNNHSLSELEGKVYYEEFTGITDPMGSDKANPVSHLEYGYACQVVILGEDGKVDKVVAAHDVGRAINPTNVEGQIEGGIVMGLGYALTEDLKIKNGCPTASFGKLGLLRSTDTPDIETILIEKNHAELAYGAKGVGEITLIPTAPATQAAYYKWDGNFRTSLPLENTPYSK